MLSLDELSRLVIHVQPLCEIAIAGSNDICMRRILNHSAVVLSDTYPRGYVRNGVAWLIVDRSGVSIGWSRLP